LFQQLRQQMWLVFFFEPLQQMWLVSFSFERLPAS